jgi:hypothetical protein
MLPAPIVLPKIHFPEEVGIVVRLRLGFEEPEAWALGSPTGVGPAGLAVAVLAAMAGWSEPSSEWVSVMARGLFESCRALVASVVLKCYRGRIGVRREEDEEGGDDVVGRNG